MLNYWTSKPANSPYTGIWVYEIDSRRKYFANAQGSSAYTFAISNDLYIPTIEGERATAMERWFSNLEGTLADFASQTHKHQETLSLNKSEDILKLLAALFALECRSPSLIQQFQTIFATSATVPRPDELVSHQLALENVINYVNECAARFSLGHMLLLYCEEPKVLLSDRPTFNHSEITHKFFVLTSKVVVALSEEMQGNGFVYRYEEQEQEILDLLNKKIALQAGVWIASTTESQLDQYIPVFDSDEWKKYRYSTKAKPVFESKKGWKIVPDDK